MTIENIDVTSTLERVNKQLKNDTDMSETRRSLIEVLVLIVTLLVNRLGLNSRNSSKPPSSDPNRKKSPNTGWHIERLSARETKNLRPPTKNEKKVNEGESKNPSPEIY